MNDPIIENGGWKSKAEADQETASGMFSLGGLMAVGSALSVYLAVMGSPWWIAAAVVLGFLAVRSWRRDREVVREAGNQAPRTSSMASNESDSDRAPPDSH